MRLRPLSKSSLWNKLLLLPRLLLVLQLPQIVFLPLLLLPLQWMAMLFVALRLPQLLQVALLLLVILLWRDPHTCDFPSVDTSQDVDMKVSIVAQTVSTS